MVNEVIRGGKKTWVRPIKRSPNLFGAVSFRLSKIGRKTADLSGHSLTEFGSDLFVNKVDRKNRN